MRNKELVKAGQWYEFKLDLWIPDGVNYPTDPVEIIRWIAAGDNGTFITAVSLIEAD